MKPKGQKQIILEALQQAGSRGITNIEINERLHIYRYSARIFDLKKEGYDIEAKHDHNAVWTFILHKPNEQTRLF